MEHHKATLVDLLDRVLDRGLVLDADIIICLAGVPLIGVNLRAALAGMETMTRYGFMKDWDQSIRDGELAARGSSQALVKALRSPALTGDCLTTRPAPCHCEVSEGDRGNPIPFPMRKIASLRLGSGQALRSQ